eukprot:scaffold116068_cov69-Phaeocystis_antarctica.AAC.5
MAAGRLGGDGRQVGSDGDTCHRWAASSNYSGGSQMAHTPDDRSLGRPTIQQSTRQPEPQPPRPPPDPV